MRVLRVSHSATVAEWRGRERALRALGHDVTVLAARHWHAGGAETTLTDGAEDGAVPSARGDGILRSSSTTRARSWRALGEQWDVVDIHEEPFALATAEVLLLRRSAAAPARPYVLYTAQNLRKRYPIPFRWLERWALRTAAGSPPATPSRRHRRRQGLRRARPGHSARHRPRAVRVPSTHDREPRRGRRAGCGWVRHRRLHRASRAREGHRAADGCCRPDPRLRLRIAGAGPLAASIPRRAGRSSGVASAFEFVGTIPPEAVGTFYRAVDVLAVPSLATTRWTEQFGRVAVEAMALRSAGGLERRGLASRRRRRRGHRRPAGRRRGARRRAGRGGRARSDELRAAGFARAAECSWEAVARELRRPVPIGAARAAVIRLVPTRRRDHRRRLRRAGLCCARPSSRSRGCRSPSSTTPRSPRSRRCAPSWACGTSTPGGNRGFGAAVNLALADRLVPGADVLLLNPDARIAARSDRRAAAARCAPTPDLASVGPDAGGRAADTSRESSGFSRRRATRGSKPSGSARLQRGPRFVIGSVLHAARRGARPGRRVRRALLPVRGGDRLGLSRASARMAACSVPRRASACTSARGRAATPAPRRPLPRLSGALLRKHFGSGGWQAARAAVWAGAMARASCCRGERGRAARRRAALYRLGPCGSSRDSGGAS